MPSLIHRSMFGMSARPFIFPVGRSRGAAILVSLAWSFLLVWPIAFGVGTSGLLLYQRVFPPELQFGSPTFITLDLERHRHHTNDSENKRD